MREVAKTARAPQGTNSCHREYYHNQSLKKTRSPSASPYQRSRKRIKTCQTFQKPNSNEPSSATNIATNTATNNRRLKTLLYLGNVSGYKRNTILRAFRFYGAVRRLWISKCESYGFIEYNNGRDANFARCRLNGKSLDPQSGHIIVNWADFQKAQ